ncbi:response regulator transcription factor [Chloroflexota bacterium]
MKDPHVLVIEKDEAVSARVAAALEGAGFNVATATDALCGLREMYESHPDVIIMATEILVADWEDSYVTIRLATYLPILVLGSSDEASEMLEFGADAFMTKPPDLRELVARVKWLIQRKPRLDSSKGKHGLDMKNSPLERDNGSSYLSATEYRLASCLILNNSRLLEYSRLINEVWAGKEVSLDTLHFYIRRLRTKLQAFFPNPIKIINYRGVGYRLEEVV